MLKHIHNVVACSLTMANFLCKLNGRDMQVLQFLCPYMLLQCVHVTPGLRDTDLLSQQLLRGGKMSLKDGVSG